jgi:hypothetical protein
MGIVFGGLFIAYYLLTMFRLYNSKKNKFLQRLSAFGDFKRCFDLSWSNFYVAAMLYRLFICIVLVIFSDSIISHGVTLSLNIIWMFVLIIISPYKKGYKLLPIINSAVMVVISCFYIYQRYYSDSLDINIAAYIPIALIVLLGLTSIFNTI